MNDELQELGRLADAATPGPWRAIKSVGIVTAKDCHIGHIGDFNDKELLPFNKDRWRADAEFIAAANPAAIKEMLTSLAEKDVEIAVKHLEANAYEKLLNDVNAEIARLKGLVANTDTQALAMARSLMQQYGWRSSDMIPYACLLYTSPSPRDLSTSRMPSSA